MALMMIVGIGLLDINIVLLLCRHDDVIELGYLNRIDVF